MYSNRKLFSSTIIGNYDVVCWQNVFSLFISTEGQDFLPLDNPFYFVPILNFDFHRLMTGNMVGELIYAMAIKNLIRIPYVSHRIPHTGDSHNLV